MTFAVCTVAGGIIAWLQGVLTSATEPGAAIVSVLITSTVLYQTRWKPSRIAPTIESRTSGT